jgi:hypothetical protein
MVLRRKCGYDKLQRVIDCLLKALTAERAIHDTSGFLQFHSVAAVVAGVPAIKKLYLRTLRQARRN